MKDLKPTPSDSTLKQGKQVCFTPEQREEINRMIDRKIVDFAKVVQDWLIEQFAPTFQNWLTEQFIPSFKITVDKEELKNN